MNKKNKFITFLLWLITGLAFTYIITINNAPINNVPHLSNVQDIVFNNSDIQNLFSGSTSKKYTKGFKSIASDFKLYGILASTNKDSSLVIIQGNNESKAKYYTINEILPNGGILKSVEARQISYEVNGKLETVELPSHEK